MLTTLILASCNTIPSELEKISAETVYRKMTFSNQPTPVTLSSKMVVEDVDFMKYIFETSYISFDAITLPGGFDFLSAFRTVRLASAQHSNLTSNEFASLIQDSFKGIRDGHFYMIAGTNYLPFSLHADYYGTGVIVQRQNDNYVVVQSSSNKVTVGSIFKGDNIQLFPKYSVTKDIYEVGSLSEIFINSIKIPFKSGIGDELVDLPVTSWVTRNISTNAITVKNSEVYISYSSIDNSTEEKVKWLTEFSRFPLTQESIKTFIIDVRGNKGGVPEYQDAFIENLGLNPLKELRDPLVEKMSPATVQTELGLLLQRRGESAAIDKKIEELKKLNSEMISTPHIFYINDKSSDLKKLLEDEAVSNKFGAKIILIINKDTASSAEMMYFQLKQIASTIVIGENSKGAVCTVNSIPYQLPNSKFVIFIPNQRTKMSEYIANGVDNSYGLLPDYWVSNDEELRLTLERLSINKDLISEVFNP